MSTEKITEIQLNWLRKHYHDAQWPELAKRFNKEFKTKKSGDALRILWGRYKHSDLSGAQTAFAHFNRESFGEKTMNLKEGRYFVSAIMPLNPVGAHMQFGEAVGGVMRGYVDQDAFLTLRHTVESGFCSPVLLTGTAHTQLGQKQPNYYDPKIMPWRDWFASAVTFNKHLRAVDLRINPQQKQPLTGLESLMGGTSMLVAHTKQNMRFVNQGNELLPLLLHSTGCLNESDMYQDNRIGNLAFHNHKLGGLIVELKGERFFVRQVQFDQQGGFYDNGYYYLAGSKPVKVRAQAIKIGDLHFGHDEEDLWRILGEVIEVTQPRMVFVEDGRDGGSHSPHLNSMAAKVKRNKSAPWFSSIQAEVDLIKNRMARLKKLLPKDCQIMFTDDNHGRFLQRYVDDAKYMYEEANFEIGHKLQLLNLQGKKLWPSLIDEANEYVFLGGSQDCFIDDWQFASHGDRGLNGSRNTKGAYPKQVDAHGHSPFIEGDHWRAGHWSKDRHGYNVGPSTWMPSLVVKYPGDCLQQIVPIRAPKDKLPYEWRS